MSDNTDTAIENLELKITDLQTEIAELRIILDRLAEVLRPTSLDPNQHRLDTA